jgi:hypothetical protein
MSERFAITHLQTRVSRAAHKRAITETERYGQIRGNLFAPDDSKICPTSRKLNLKKSRCA